jgi:hypothetical protein
MGVVGLVLAWIGAALVVGNSVLVAFGRMEWQEGGMYTAIGYGLVGIWLIIAVISSPLIGELSHSLRPFGIAVGAALVFGLIAGPLLAGKISVSIKPLVWLVYAMTGIGWIGFPIWCWILSRRLL